SAGVARGPARLVRNLEDFAKFRHGDVLVCQSSNVSWIPLFTSAAAVVTEVGGPLSHAAVVAREFGIPAVVGTSVALSTLGAGERERGREKLERKLARRDRERGESSAEEEGAGERRQARSVAIGGAASERREDDRAAREGGERDPAPHARAGERHGKREQRPVHREVLKSDGRARRREGANPKERRRERRIRMTRLVPQERDRGWE